MEESQARRPPGRRLNRIPSWRHPEAVKPNASLSLNECHCRRDWSEMEYFSLRLLAQRRQWSDLTREAIERYGQLHARHRGAAPERRYRAWVREGMPPRPEGGDFSRHCCWREVLMDFDYSAADRAER